MNFLNKLTSLPNKLCNLFCGKWHENASAVTENPQTLQEEKNDKDSETVKEEKEKMQRDIELQLHQQFAQNYNDTFRTIMTLFVALLAVLAAYGHIFLNSSAIFSDDLGGPFVNNDGFFYLDALVLVTFASWIMLTFLIYLCWHLGVNQRLEQFIAYAIRSKYYRKDEEDKDWIKKKFPIFPPGYHPFKGEDDDIPVGIYKLFADVMHCLQIIIFLGLVYKFVLSFLSPPIVSFNVHVICEFLVLGVMGVCFCHKCKKRKDQLIEKYKNRKQYYKDIDPTLAQEA